MTRSVFHEPRAADRFSRSGWRHLGAHRKGAASSRSPPPFSPSDGRAARRIRIDQKLNFTPRRMDRTP